jgi:chromosome segregation ATPase
LESEEQSYQLLNETLVGQRQRLYEKQYSLKKHEEVLHRRQEQPQSHHVDFRSLSNQAQQQQQNLQCLLATVSQHCQTTQAQLAQTQAEYNQRQGELSQWQHHLEEQEKNLHQDQATFEQQQGTAAAYRQTLPQIQEQVNQLRETLQQEQDSRRNGYYSHLLGELNQVVRTLTAA